MRPLDRLRTVVRGLIPAGGVGERTVKSGIWAALINVSDRALQLAMVVVLARLLDPADFGLFGIVLLALAVMQRFTRLGFDTALIQNEAEDVDDYIDTVWALQVARGLVIFAVAYVAAPAVAGFFGEPRTTTLLRVTALAPLLVGLRNPFIVYFRKDLEFHRQFAYRLSGTVVQVTTAVALAVVYGNVWALVAGSLVGHIVRTLVSYLISRRRPGVGFDLVRARDLVGYGKWITGFSILGFLFDEGDDAFVGWFLGAAALGFYQTAYRLSQAPSTEVTNVISMTMLATYSKIQNDVATLRRTYFDVLSLVVSVSAPMAVGIVVVAPDFVPLVLGPDWLPMVGVMQVLAVWGYMRSIGASSGPLLQAIGRPDYTTKASAAKTVLLAVLIYPATATFGIVGTGAAVVLSAALTSEPYVAYVVLSELQGSVTTFLWRIAVPTVAALVMGGVVVGVRWTVPFDRSLPLFVGLILVGAASYGVTLLAADRLLGYGLRDLVASVARHGAGSEVT